MKNSAAFLIALIAFLVVSTGAVWLSFSYDQPVRAEIVKSQKKGWKKSDAQKFHAGVRRYGDWPYLMVYGGVALLVAWKLRNREWQRILAAAMIASTLAGIIANTSRLTTGRTRPKESPKIEQGFYGPWKDGKTTIGSPAYNSFPSGHTATAFGFAWVLVLARPWLGLGGLILASLVGWSSIVMGSHHPSDVVVSILLSFAVGWFTWKWVRENGERFAHEWGEKFRRWRRGKKASVRLGQNPAGNEAQGNS